MDQELLEALRLNSGATDEEIMQMIENGADVNALNGFNQNALHLVAIWHPDLSSEQILTIIAKTEDINHQDAPWGHTALSHAVIANNISVVRALMSDNRLDINIQTHPLPKAQAYTALHFAVKLRYYEMVKQLLGKIDTEIRNAYDETALDIADRNKYYEIAFLIRGRRVTRQSEKVKLRF